MFALDNIVAGYAETTVLRGVSLTVPDSSVVALLGPNGAGKTTLLRVASGLLRPTAGTMTLDGVDVTGHRPHQLAGRGVCHVPEGRGVFPTLTVRQNLLLGVKNTRRTARWTIDDMFAMFPALRQRADNPGGVLSGGEQQMLTICRTLMGDPHLIMVDEPTEGLAPMLVTQVADLLVRIAARGVSILLVEQKLTIALTISRRVYVMGHGRVVFEGTPDELRRNDGVRKEWLEV